MNHARRHRLRGASLVEFAVVFPAAVLFVLALIQVGFLYMAKLTLNHAVFMAARAGSLNNARMASVRETLVRGLGPFYQDSTVASDVERTGVAYLRAQADAVPFVDITVLNPSSASFADFGVQDPVRRVTYIPNDNLQWRSDTVGARSGQNIRDANLLKLRVVYGYELKVPLMASVLRWAMCSGGSVLPLSAQCPRYYALGRVPIEAFAILEMQSRAERATAVAGGGGSAAGVTEPTASSTSAGVSAPLAAGAPGGTPASGNGTGGPGTSLNAPTALARHCDSANGSECRPPPCEPGAASCASPPTCESG
jgi:hypothetical protein